MKEENIMGDSYKFVFVSNMADTSLWVDNVYERDIDYSSFMYDAKQYKDVYVSSLINPKEVLKEIVYNAVIAPNLVKFQGKNFISVLDTFVNIQSCENGLLSKGVEGFTETEICLNGIYIKSYLDNNGIPTKLLSDIYLDSDFTKNLNDFSKDAIAIGISTTFIVDWDVLKDIAAFVRTVNPKIKIIIGGPLAFLLRSIDAQSKNIILSKLCGSVDYIIVEQNGEETLKNLLLSINSGASIEGIPNLIAFSEKSYKISQFVEEKGTFDENVIRWDKVELPKEINTVPIETSRGCPFRCNFCSYTKYHKYKLKPLNALREELRSLKNCPTIKYISFVDGSLNAIPTRVKEICRILIEEELDLKWHFMGNVKGLDKEQADLMARAGCEIANIGIESGNEFIRTKMNKPIESNEQVKTAFHNLSNSGIIGRGYFFVGYPGENEQTICDTISLINSTDMDLFRLAIFRPRINSDVCFNEKVYNNQLQGKGYLWKHYTCDSLQASRYLLEILRQTKPCYDPARGVYELMQAGYPKSLALKLNQLKNEMTKNILNGYEPTSYEILERDFRRLLNSFTSNSTSPQ